MFSVSQTSIIVFVNYLFIFKSVTETHTPEMLDNLTHFPEIKLFNSEICCWQDRDAEHRPVFDRDGGQ